MVKKVKSSTYHFRLDKKFIRKLDKKITRAGYTYRSDFFKAVGYVLLHGINFANEADTEPQLSESSKCCKVDKHTRDAVQNLPKSVTAWLAGVIPETTDEEILVGLHKTLEKYLLPAIAMNGADAIFEDTWEVIRDLYHEESGIWVTESDCLEAYQSFELLRKKELTQYREEQMKKRQLEGDEL